MEEKKVKKNKKNVRSIRVTAIPFISAALATGFYFLLRPTEIRTSKRQENESLAVLDCKSESLVGAFFTLGNARGESHEIKATIKDEKPDKLTYTYIGTFADNTEAQGANATLHARYNIYMGQNAEDAEPYFSAIGDRMKINLFIDSKRMSKKLSTVYALNLESDGELANYDYKTLKTTYEQKGFSCVYTE